MRILITGVAGFIGSNLADYFLKKNHEIIGIDDLSYGLIEQVPKEVSFYEANILNKSKYSLPSRASTSQEPWLFSRSTIVSMPSASIYLSIEERTLWGLIIAFYSINLSVINQILFLEQEMILCSN